MSHLAENTPSYNRFSRSIAAFALALIALWNSDVAIGYISSYEPTTIQRIYETDKNHEHELIITTTGYGDPDYYDLASTVYDILHPSNVAMVDYGSGIDIGSLKDTLINIIKENKYEKVSLYGVSLGGMVAIELAAELIKSGYPIDTVYLDSTPSSLGTTTAKSRIGSQIVENVPVGYTARRLGELSIKIFEQHDGSLGEKVGYSMDKSNKMPTKLLKSQSKYLSRGIQTSSIETLNKSKVRIVYIRTKNPKDDTMVNVKASAFDFGYWFSHVQTVEGDDLGHASTTHKEDEVRELLAKANQAEK